MEIIKSLLKKEREYVSKFMNTTEMSDYEVDLMFDKLVREQEQKERKEKEK